MDPSVFWSYRVDVETALRGIPGKAVEEAEAILRGCRNVQGTVYLIGNGGSAATASHFANDLLKMCLLRAVAIPAMMPTVTAYGNDLGWVSMFSGPLEQSLRPSDVVIAISCSGESENVINAVNMAMHFPRGIVRTIVMTGDNLHSSLAALKPDVVINVPFRDIRVQEDCHMVICHAIAGSLSLGPKV